MAVVADKIADHAFTAGDVARAEAKRKSATYRDGYEDDDHDPQDWWKGKK